MRNAPIPFPAMYRLEETCAGIAANARRIRAVSAAAIGAIAGYRIDQGQLAGIVSYIAPVTAREGNAE